MSDGNGPVVCAVVALVPVAYQYVQALAQPQVVADAIDASFPFLPCFFRGLTTACVACLLSALLAKYKASLASRAGTAAAWCSGLAVLCMIPVGFCQTLTIHSGVRIFWRGLHGVHDQQRVQVQDPSNGHLWQQQQAIQNVLDHGYPSLCTALAPKEPLGQVFARGCDHLCLYSPAQLLSPIIDAAMAMVLEEVQSIDTPNLPDPQKNGGHAPLGTCVSDREYDDFQQYVKHEPTALSRLFLSFALFLLSHLVLLCMICSPEASARERAIVEPLLRADETTA